MCVCVCIYIYIFIYIYIHIYIYSQTCLKQQIKGVSKNGCLRQVAAYCRLTGIGILKCILLCMLSSDVYVKTPKIGHNP